MTWNSRMSRNKAQHLRIVVVSIGAPQVLGIQKRIVAVQNKVQRIPLGEFKRIGPVHPQPMRHQAARAGIALSDRTESASSFPPQKPTLKPSLAGRERDHHAPAPTLSIRRNISISRNLI